MEQDDEIKGQGNSLDFGARIYDSRLGRFLSVEPLFWKYSSLTTYSFAGNSSIVLIDKNGEFPWITGLVGGGINIAIGYIGAQITDKEYTWKNALKDGAVGFAVGSGAAFIAPALGVTMQSTLLAKVATGAFTGMVAGASSNALTQGVDVFTGEQESFETKQVVFSGLIGILSGTVTSGIGHHAEKFMEKVGDKMFKEFTKYELIQYTKYVSEYLKKEFQARGIKITKKHLQKKIEQKVKDWSEIKANEIAGLKIIAVEGTKTTADVAVSIAGVKLYSELDE